MRSGARQLSSSLVRLGRRLVGRGSRLVAGARRFAAHADLRLRLVVAAGVVGCLVVALVASGLVSGSTAPPARHRAGPAPSMAAGGQQEGGGATAAVASPATLVPDTAVTVAPTPIPIEQVPSGGGAPRPTGQGPGPPPPAPRYPTPKPEPNRTAPAQPVPPAPPPGAVTAGDFPDPAVLRVGTTYYAYSTQVGAIKVPVIRSLDMVHWQSLGDALANLPAWSGGVSVWAPSVVRSASGYVLFYSTHDDRTGDQCISRAVSVLPQGPFVDTSANPFVCQLNLGGAIDPDAFVDNNGAQWLIWKSQGTLNGVPPQIWAQAVGGDWAFLVGQPKSILSVDQLWEGGVIEAPTLMRVGSLYYLLYSGNLWSTGAYAIGYAVCRTVTGPCTKPLRTPAVATHGDEAGPGSPGLFLDALGRLRIAYHAWTPPHIGYPGGERSLHIGSVTVIGTQLSITEP